LFTWDRLYNVLPLNKWQETSAIAKNNQKNCKSEEFLKLSSIKIDGDID